ncbi:MULTISPECIES: HupE/UreJ family protein [unclassified Aureimonas]|uniref:HupE/UreJ family protein n=1 Tax=unclassified Aureimonas TaxID=2615206 RepID=UPI0006F45F63|nr:MULTISPECIES: HupE/UreJ family protein [unclassified Aureimonas]KQT70091.1 protein hupE [Aureimonas sp. Leaf427]KQT76268.1 protein hupE [Aureimonas sp. Leaf460]
MIRRLSLAAVTLLAASAPAFAHLDPAEHGSVMAGLSHPLFGADHILAMVAVGLWASQIGGRGTYAVPAAFVGVMSLGFLLGQTGLSLPFVEPMIAASVVVLGLLVAAAVRLPVAAGAALVGAFALFHGYAHASELGSAGALSFAAGFLAATALLHLAGIGIGLALSSGAGFGRSVGGALARILGAGTAIAGLALMAG